mgnify:CR=1 FL=1
MANSVTPEGYKDTILGVVPQEWNIRCLGDLLSRCTNGLTYNVSISNGIPVTRIETISTGEINYAKVGHIQNSVGYEDFRMQKGDILYSHINSLSQIGKVAYYNGKKEIYHGMNLLLLRANQCLNKQYLYYMLLTTYMRHMAQVIAKPAVNQASISTRDLKKIKIPVPPLPEQQKIAEVLSTWDKAIEKQSQLIEKLELRKKGLMQQLLTGKKRLPGFNIPWKKIKLGEMGNTYNGLSGKNKDDFEQGNAKFIPYINVFSNEKIDVNNLQCVKINPEDQQNMVKYGDIFFTVSSETPDEVGMASVLLEHLDNTYLNSFCFGYRLKDFSTLSPFFAAYLFRTEHFRHYMNILAQGSTRFNLSKKEVMKLRINIPVIKEQITIYKVLNTADREIELAQQKLDILRQQKHGLMQQLLTGKKRVKYEN